MDNTPRFKLAKVGEKKRRKGAGFSWFGGKPGTGSLFGLGGSGAGSAAGGATGLARTIAALLENNQAADGSVRIPAALAPYVGTDRLSP